MKRCAQLASCVEDRAIMSAVDAEIDANAVSDHAIPPVAVSSQPRLSGASLGPALRVCDPGPRRAPQFPKSGPPQGHRNVQIQAACKPLTGVRAVLARREDPSSFHLVSLCLARLLGAGSNIQPMTCALRMRQWSRYPLYFKAPRVPANEMLMNLFVAGEPPSRGSPLGRGADVDVQAIRGGRPSVSRDDTAERRLSPPSRCPRPRRPTALAHPSPKSGKETSGIAI